MTTTGTTSRRMSGVSSRLVVEATASERDFATFVSVAEVAAAGRVGSSAPRLPPADPRPAAGALAPSRVSPESRLAPESFRMAAAVARSSRPDSRNAAARLIETRVFRGAILAAIVVGAILVGLETSREVMDQIGPVIVAIDRLVLAAFVLEILLRLAAHGGRPWRFFLDGWNVFDFAIVAACILPTGSGSLQVFRLVRVLRVLRLASAVPGLQILVAATLRSIPSLLYVLLMLMLLLYTYAVVGVFAFGGNDPVHFGSLPRALLTLFGVLTLEGWIDVMRIQMIGSAAFEGYPTAMADRPPVSAASPGIAVLYFVSFVLVGTMVVLNLLVGIVVQGMEAAHAEVMKTEPSASGGTA